MTTLKRPFLHDISDIRSAWQGHGFFAIWLARNYAPKTVVELGIDFGFSTFCFAYGQFLAQHKDGTVVYGIDSFEGDKHSGFRDTEKAVRDKWEVLKKKYRISPDNLKLVKNYFHEESIKWKKEKTKPLIDLLHIDGLHTYEAISQDFNDWIDLTGEDAIILMHDTLSFPDTVGKFFNEIPYAKFNFLHTHGLGVVSKNTERLRELYNQISKNREQFGEVGKFIQPQSQEKSNINLHIEDVVNNNVAILLTTTVNTFEGITFLAQNDPNDRLDIYTKSISNWLKSTRLPIVVVENSGYTYTKLQDKYKSEIDNGRLEIVSFTQEMLDSDEKGYYECLSVKYAVKHSKIVQNCDYVVKVTGRYFIPTLENFLNSNELECDVILQSIDTKDFLRSKVVIGFKKELCLYLFDEFYVHKNFIVEASIREKCKKLEVTKFPRFEIEPTRNGAFNQIITEL